jgi:HD superfamily phosphohydrolase
MLQRIIKRAKHINAVTKRPLDKFLQQNNTTFNLEEFCRMDDYDVLSAIKEWGSHDDKVLSYLCNGITNRNLLKVKYSAAPVDEALLQEKTKEACTRLNITEEEAGWLVFTGEAVSSTYNFEDEHIRILFKDGSVKDISEVDNALIIRDTSGKIKKQYICYVRP